MTTTAKTQKDKIQGPNPRLIPRPTAASAARLVRNATNRNMLPSASQKISPARQNSPGQNKVKNLLPRSSLRADSKTDIKMSLSPGPEPPLIEDADVPNSAVQEVTTLINDDVTTVTINSEESDESTTAAILQKTNEVDKFVLGTSRPQTPIIRSRPQTPKSLLPSRPVTPPITSCPTTAVPPVQRYSNQISRPNTPHRLATPTRPKTPAVFPASSNKIRPDTPSSQCLQISVVKTDEDIKSVYMTKQRQFHRMKKELDLKQQAVLEIFDSLRNLRERMSREGVGCGEGMHHQDLVIFNVADWAADEIAQFCRDALASSNTDKTMELISSSVLIDESALIELYANVVNVPADFAELCLQAFTSRQEIIDWAKGYLENQDDKQDEALEAITRYNNQGILLCETLRELKNRADVAIDTITQLSKRAHRERSALLAVGESLLREIARLRQDLEACSANVNEMSEPSTEQESEKVLQDTQRELEEERAAKNAIKDKLANTESQLRQTRARVSKMDRQLREAEASIASLTGTVKMLEDQSRQKEVQLEARARKLRESLKTGEVTSSQLATQRDALQAEVLELKEQIEKLTVENKCNMQDMAYQLKDVKKAFEEQCKLTGQEMESKKAAELALADSQNYVEELRAKITELENSRPNPDLPTEREMDLWAELQATKDTLRTTEDEVTACKREKVRFLETLTKITESQNKIGLQQKLAAELLSKEEMVGKMQIQIRELTKNIRLNEQKVIQYEQYVRDLQAHNRAVGNCQEAPNGISYQDLQQDIMNLRMNLLDAVHRNEELSELLAQKEQQLEQQDKTSRAQARVIKVREELINMLKNKETEQSRELSALQEDLEHRMKIVDEVNKQIAAKADEIQELFTTLENKQQQIHRLEKIVLALEEQQRRAQAQRTRHEEKIAALEHEIAAGGNRRERKFVFF